MPLRRLRVREYSPKQYFLRRDRSEFEWFDPIETARLIHLSTDRVAANRDWAVFYLGQAKRLSPVTKRAILRAAHDRHEDTAAEARLTLAKLRDRLALSLIRKSLARSRIGVLDIKAAGELAHGSLTPLLRRHLNWESERDLVEKAIHSCQTRNRAGYRFD